jgi:hypothetical protein
VREIVRLVVVVGVKAGERDVYFGVQWLFLRFRIRRFVECEDWSAGFVGWCCRLRIR